MQHIKYLLIATCFALVSAPSLAQTRHAYCGTPPEFDRKNEETEKLKGDLQGKAQALSKLFGSAELGGQVEKERKTIYESASQAEAARAFAYFQYVICVLIFDDKAMNTPEKLKAWESARQRQGTEVAPLRLRYGEGPDDLMHPFVVYNTSVAFAPDYSSKDYLRICLMPCQWTAYICNLFNERPLGDQLGFTPPNDEKIMLDVSNRLYRTLEYQVMLQKLISGENAKVKGYCGVRRVVSLSLITFSYTNQVGGLITRFYEFTADSSEFDHPTQLQEVDRPYIRENYSRVAGTIDLFDEAKNAIELRRNYPIYKPE